MTIRGGLRFPLVPPRRRGGTRAALAAWIFGLLLAGPAQAQAQLGEAQAKAAFVLNFARYVEWPASAFAGKDAPVVACVVGRDTLGGALAALEGRQVQGRALHVVRGVLPEEARACHLAFYGESDPRRLVAQLRHVGGAPVLTVSDAERFVELGGGIGIVVGDDRLQFEVGRAALESAQLKASASLLKLARNLP